MTFLKWLLIVVVAIYGTVLVVLFVRQRAMLFPISAGRSHRAGGGRLSSG